MYCSEKLVAYASGKKASRHERHQKSEIQQPVRHGLSLPRPCISGAAIQPATALLARCILSGTKPDKAKISALTKQGNINLPAPSRSSADTTQVRKHLDQRSRPLPRNLYLHAHTRRWGDYGAAVIARVKIPAAAKESSAVKSRAAPAPRAAPPDIMDSYCSKDMSKYELPSPTLNRT